MTESIFYPHVIKNSPSIATRFNHLVELSGWTEKDGDIQGFFKSRPIGNRCLWSCVWIANDGVLNPNSYAPIESMDVKALILEAQDVINTLPRDLSQRVAVELAAALGNDSGSTYMLGSILREVRDRYPEYLAPWKHVDTFFDNGSRRVFIKRFRAGWDVVTKAVNDGQ